MGWFISRDQGMVISTTHNAHPPRRHLERKWEVSKFLRTTPCSPTSPTTHIHITTTPAVTPQRTSTSQPPSSPRTKVRGLQVPLHYPLFPHKPHNAHSPQQPPPSPHNAHPHHNNPSFLNKKGPDTRLASIWTWTFKTLFKVLSSATFFVAYCHYTLANRLLAHNRSSLIK